jgi:hypothetical protein
MAVLIGGAMGGSCTTEPAVSHRLQFVADSGRVYRSCMAGEGFYCFKTQASTERFAGVLHLSTRTLAAGGVEYVLDGATVLLDSTSQNYVVSNSCYRLRMQLVIVDGSQRGTWARQKDCHGLSDAGHFEPFPPS